MTTDTTPRWLYHVPSDTDKARRQAEAAYLDRFAQYPTCQPRKVATKAGVTLCYPLPGDTFSDMEFVVAEVALSDGVQLGLF